MGLIASIRRLHYVWSWRVRYWWLDTRQGEQAHWVACGLAAVAPLSGLDELSHPQRHPDEGPLPLPAHGSHIRTAGLPSSAAWHR